tara:strand:- start:1579 stop:3141 length:1563 start_codon:yes stop_codon:yes gene_type:complete
MCGIFGSISDNALSDIYEGLSRLEYRGYDSFGYVRIDNGKVYTCRHLGPIEKSSFTDEAELAVGHVRWATNGEVTHANTHPQATDGFYVVHNGVIENAPPHMLDTKWLANLISLCNGKPKEIYHKVQGDNAFVFVSENTEEVWCVAKGTKRLFITPNGYVSSDLNALSGFSKSAWILENGVCGLDSEELPYGRDAIHVPKTDDLLLSSGHRMLAEIKEQCDLKSLRWHNIETDLDIVATGSSLHAAMFGAYALEKRKSIKVRCIHASQAKYKSIGPNILAISQSGETKDVVNAMQGRDFMCITNNPHSTLSGMSTSPIDMYAGIERAVAATKTFTASCMKLCQSSGVSCGEMTECIADLIHRVDEIKQIADRIMGYEHFLFLGDRHNYPIALEGALKFKEVAYVHAEGMPSSEMKHGPIALVDYRVPSMFVITEGVSPETLANMQEIKCRKGLVLAITHDSIKSDIEKIADIVFSCKDTGEEFSQSLVLNVVLQLLSYYIAVERGINPDRPRNLAKCVTV